MPKGLSIELTNKISDGLKRLEVNVSEEEERSEDNLIQRNLEFNDRNIGTLNKIMYEFRDQIIEPTNLNWKFLKNHFAYSAQESKQLLKILGEHLKIEQAKIKEAFNYQPPGFLSDNSDSDGT